MKNVILLLVVNGTLAFEPPQLHAQAPAWQWAQSAGDSAVSDYGTSIATDAVGNVYVAGEFNSQTITFGNTTLTKAGVDNIFVVKLDQAGNTLWARSAGGPAGVAGIGVDGNGNVYIGGNFKTTISFGTTTLTAATSGVYDIFVTKFDPNGNPLWAKYAGSTGDDQVHGLGTDPTGNVYLTGVFSSATMAIGSTTLTAVGQGDIFVAKYDTNGNPLWVKSAGSTNTEKGFAIASTDGNVYVTGFFSGSLSIGTNALTGNTSGSMYVACYDAMGNVLWAKNAVGAPCAGNGVATDGSNVYVTGSFNGSAVTFGNVTINSLGYVNVYTVKYDQAGNVLWARSDGGAGNEGSTGISAIAGNIYITGSFFGPTTTFGAFTLNSSSNDQTAYLAGYDTLGNVIWATSPASATGLSHGFALCANAAGMVYTTGLYTKTASFGNIPLTTGSQYNVYIAKLFSPVGIAEYANGETVNIYPNPFSTNTTIQFNKQLGNATLVIYNATGQVVGETNNINGDAVVIDRNNLPAGIYYCWVREDGGATQVAKVVVVD